MSPTGVITSPNYPGQYPHRRICVWKIRVAEGRRVTLTFDEFDLEAHPRCVYDYVTVGCEYSTSTVTIYSYHVIIIKLCFKPQPIDQNVKKKSLPFLVSQTSDNIRLSSDRSFPKLS